MDIIETIPYCARACLKNHSCNLHAPLWQYISPKFGCRSPLRRPHPGKISYKLSHVLQKAYFKYALKENSGIQTVQ